MCFYLSRSQPRILSMLDKGEDVVYNSMGRYKKIFITPLKTY